MTATPPAPQTGAAPSTAVAPLLRHGAMTPVGAAAPAEGGELDPRRPTPLAGAGRRAGARRRRASLLLFWLAPTLAYGVYIFLIAAPIYMSEAKFLVRAPSTPAPIVLPTPQTANMGRSSDETQIIEAFMSSRDIADELARTIGLRDIYERPEADFFGRLSTSLLPDTAERLHRHFQNWTKADVDEGSGITTVRAYAHRAQDARAVTAGMIATAESLVNRLNARAYDDRLAYAQTILDKARAEVAAAEATMTAFRNSTRTVDMGRESAAMLEQVAKMSTELASQEVALRRQIALTPNNPGIPSARARIDALRREIDGLRRKVVGEAGSISGDLGEFERLTFERTLAARSMESAIANFDKVRQQAQVQQFYLVRISEPSLPGTAEYPRRVTSFLSVAAALLLAWAAIGALVRLVREHEA